MTKEQRQEIFQAGFRAWQNVGSISQAIERKANELNLNLTENELTNIQIDLSIHIQTLKDWANENILYNNIFNTRLTYLKSFS